MKQENLDRAADERKTKEALEKEARLAKQAALEGAAGRPFQPKGQLFGQREPMVTDASDDDDDEESLQQGDP